VALRTLDAYGRRLSFTVGAEARAVGVAALVGSVLVLLLEPAVGAPSPAGLAEALVPALALLVGGRTLLRLVAGGLRGRGDVGQLGGVPVIHVSRRHERLALAAKRILDLVVGGLLALALAPFLAAMAVAVKLDSRGPVLFRQRRVGRDGVEFEMWKFRTMDVDAERQLESLLADNMLPGLFKLAHDPRVTRVGHWLRRTSLDELPQLWNVLRGEMSLVGPRPALAHEIAEVDEVTL